MNPSCDYWKAFIGLKCMNKLIYIAAYEVILKMFFQSKTMSWILTSFGYFFQMPCVCIFLRLKSLPFLMGLWHLLLQISLPTRATRLYSYRASSLWNIWSLERCSNSDQLLQSKYCLTTHKSRAIRKRKVKTTILSRAQ